MHFSVTDWHKAKLSIRESEVYRLRNFHNISYANIAQCLGITKASARGMFSRAKKKILASIEPVVLSQEQVDNINWDGPNSPSSRPPVVHDLSGVDDSSG